MTTTQPIQTPIKAVLLSDLVQERMLTDIVTGRYAPGARLNLDEIAGECGVSRMPIREALQALAGIGFVSFARNARTLVADWSAEDMRERVVVLGRLIAHLATDPREVFDIEHHRVRVGVESDFAVYLDLVTEMIGCRLPRLAEYMQRAFIAPLRLFVRADVLASHGLDATTGREERTRHLVGAFDAFTTGDRDRISRSLTRYADEFAVALTLPRVGLGSHSRAPRSPEPTHAHA